MVNRPIDQFIADNYTKLQEASRNISGNNPLSEELLHYCLAEFLEKPNLDKILDSGGGVFYFVRMLLNSWRSTTSTFYRNYRKPHEQIPENSYLFVENPASDQETEEETAKKVRDILKDIHWYDRKLIEVYADEQHTMSSLSRSTGIPRTSISLTINRVRKHVKSKL